MTRTCSISNVRVEILLWYQRAETIASLQVPGRITHIKVCTPQS